MGPILEQGVLLVPPEFWPPGIKGSNQFIVGLLHICCEIYNLFKKLGNRNLFGPMGNHCATLQDTRAFLQPAVAATILKKIKTVIVVASSCTSVMEKHFASSSQS